MSVAVKQNDIYQNNNSANVELLEYLRHKFIAHYGIADYTDWFANVTILNDKTNVVELRFANKYIEKWITRNYFDALKAWCTEHNPDLQLLLITSQYSSAITQPKIVDFAVAKTEQGLHKSKKYDATDLGFLTESKIDNKFSFDNFVVGKPNELAYAASRAIAESDSAMAGSNPLFLYGGVGLGKTHLMHAIARHIHQTNNTRKVVYMSAEKFMYEFVSALRKKETLAFKDYFRSVDVLMIDDIQFICGKDSTQEEFFHTFNTIIDNNRQMVISCDRSPSDLDNIEERIKSRLGWGLVADVHSTTYELRLGILHSKIEYIGAYVPQDVIEFLATKITSNVRELEGSLNKVIANAKLTNSSINVENTKLLLSDLLKSSDKEVSVEEVQSKVAERYNIRITDICSNRRMRNLARPRQIAMYLCKQTTSKSLLDIGRRFGKKDHTTVIHAIKTVEELMAQNYSFTQEIETLKRIIQS